MKFRNIPSPIYTYRYVVDDFYYSKTESTLTINLWHAITFENFRAKIYFREAAALRFTPLDCGFSEYSDLIRTFMKQSPDEGESYRGIVEAVDYDELKKRITWPNCKHYIIITEDEYVEVVSEEDPIVERTVIPEGFIPKEKY